MKKNELTRKKIGKWTVGEGFSKNGQRYFHCTCECGKEADILSYALNKGKSLSCSSCSKVGKGKDRIGEKIGYLTVIGKRVVDNRTEWECRCMCGNIIFLESNKLTLQKSCGCRPDVSDHIRESIKDHCKDGTYIPAITRNTVNKNNSTGVTGVNYRPDRGKYRAYIKYQKKYIHLGNFDTLEEAAEARKIAEKHYFGKYLDE